MRRAFLLGAGLACALAVHAPAAAADGPSVPTLAIGSAAPDFDLPGVDGKRYSLASFAHAKVLVFVFTANHCPTAQAYEERIEQPARRLRPAAALRSCSSRRTTRSRSASTSRATRDLGDSLEDMKIRAKDRGWTFPYLYDGDTEAMSRQYGPVATPHVFVFDAEREAALRGPGGRRREPGEGHDQRHAQRHRGGPRPAKPVPVETTKVFGCSVKWSDKRGSVKEGSRSGRRNRSPSSRSTRRGSRARAPTTAARSCASSTCGPPGAGLAHRVPRHGVPPPHLPRPGVRGGHDQRRRPREARGGARVPEVGAGLDAQPRLRQGRPVRPHRGGRPEVAGRPASHDRRGPAGAR